MPSDPTSTNPATSLEHNLKERLHRLNEIGVALSTERNLNTLLERILTEARAFTRADAGTLYLVNDKVLNFEISHNDTLGSHDSSWGGAAEIPPVPIDKKSASGFAATTGETLNIADVYLDEEHQFEGPKIYDELTGYRTQSMLVVPMKDHQGHIIAVLELLIATDHQGSVIPFAYEEDLFIQSLASQAAVAINNVRLIEETRQLSRQMVQSERMASVGLVAAGIVHNLKNPLMIIQGYSELIQHLHPDLKDIDKVVDASHRMNEMIEDILAKSRQRRDIEAVDFNLLLRQELDFMEVDSNFKRKVETVVDLAQDLPLYECAYSDFSQTVGNLLRNAVDAMHKCKEKKLTVRSTLSADLIILEIEDTGCGIPAENISRLFHPFFTTKATTANGNEPVGTGLGLYMIKCLMEPYDAEIGVESTVDVGTTFRLKIPRTKKPS